LLIYGSQDRVFRDEIIPELERELAEQEAFYISIRTSGSSELNSSTQEKLDALIENKDYYLPLCY
jgi:hypothetical protein